MENKFSERDLDQISSKGIELTEIENQINQYTEGFPYMNITQAATLNKGIMPLSSEDVYTYINLYNEYLESNHTVYKFVPASGAASRMFKELFAFLNASEEEQNKLKQEGTVHNFLTDISKFAFAKQLEEKCKVDFSNSSAVFENAALIIKTLLDKNGLAYGNKPKGVLTFHRSNNRFTTPIEEHLIEAALYCKNKHSEANVHFTVSPAHQALFQKLIANKIEYYENRYKVKYNINFSTQKSCTDTIAVNMDNTPFKTSDNKLLFRPGGHGALIQNLNDIDADVIFIKNIDNIVPENKMEDTITYKKVLAGILCKYQKFVFDTINNINNGKKIDTNQVLDVMQNELCIKTPESIKNADTPDIVEYIKEKLDRPIRVCGMVKNQGEAGGGPFWTVDSKGATSLQIVEGPQIDMNNEESVDLLKQSTHFNPVDIVLSPKSNSGQKYDLTDFIDYNTGFIATKSLNGKSLKSLELPGLWNGAMSDWISIFVEVPISTFNPVKTVIDLLRQEHQ